MYGIYLKFNQVIYILDTNCEPNIMVLAQAVIQIFCSQCPLWLKCVSLQRGIILSNIQIMLCKVNQVVYIMYPNCMPDITILAQAVLQIYMSQDCFTINNSKVGKGHNSVKYLQKNFKMLIRSFTCNRHKLHAKYYDHSSSGHPDNVVTLFLMAKMPKSEKGHNSVL